MREVRLNAQQHVKFLAVMEKKLAERGMTMKELAEAIGVSERSIYNFRNDKSRDPSKFLGGKLATFLEMKPSDWR